MSEVEVTNLDRLRAVTEHVRHYVGLEDTLSQVGVMGYAEVLLWASALEDQLRAFTQWAVSVEAAEVAVIESAAANYHLKAYGELAGGMVVQVTIVVTDPAPLKAGGIKPGTSVPVEQIATLTAVAS